MRESLSTPLMQAALLLALQLPGALCANNTDAPRERSLVRVSSVEELKSAFKHAKAGDSLVIAGGTYFGTFKLEADGAPGLPIVVTAAPGSDVVLTGAEVVSDEAWQQVETSGVWRITSWTQRPQKNSTRLYYPDNKFHELIGRTEQVIVAGSLLRQVATMNELTPGTFYSDPLREAALYVYLRDGVKPSGVLVSKRAQILEVSGSNIILRNLTVRFASNRAQEGAVTLGGAKNVMEDCVVEWTNGRGMNIKGEGNIVRRVSCRYNGQIGMGGFGTDNTMEDCVLLGNNVKGYDIRWEAGGIKIVHTKTFTLRRCIAVANNGNGFWFDLLNSNGLVEECVASKNTCSGIYVEISSAITVRNNVSLENGVDGVPGAWNNSGILLGESNDCIVEDNICLWNRTGIAVRQQRIRKDVYASHGHTMQRNISAYNREWQFAFYADHAGFGLHPKEVLNLKQVFVQQETTPAGLAWTTRENDYYAEPGHGFLCWGAPWRSKHVRFDKLADFQQTYSVEIGSSDEDPKALYSASQGLQLSASALAAKYHRSAIPNAVVKAAATEGK